MDTNKFGAIWRILKSKKDLRSQIELWLYLRRYSDYLQEETYNKAAQTGELLTLSTLISIIDEKLDGRK